MMELRLEAVTQSIRRARAWVRHRAGAAPADTVSTAELLTSELVTNAVKYGPPDGSITVRAESASGVLAVSVTDESHRRPVVRVPEPSAVGGRGMQMVDVLSSDWGVRLHPGDGKSVWFRLRH